MAPDAALRRSMLRGSSLGSTPTWTSSLDPCFQYSFHSGLREKACRNKASRRLLLFADSLGPPYHSSVAVPLVLDLLAIRIRQSLIAHVDQAVKAVEMYIALVNAFSMSQNINISSLDPPQQLAPVRRISEQCLDQPSQLLPAIVH